MPVKGNSGKGADRVVQHITASGTYVVTQDLRINIAGGGSVILQGASRNDTISSFSVSFSDKDTTSDEVILDLSTFDENIRIDIFDYDSLDRIFLDGAFNERIDVDTAENYLFDFIGEDGATYTATIRAKDSGERDWSADPSPVVICYAPGTMISTPAGPRKVETLTEGDLVMTLDHGPQPILWIRHSRQFLAGKPRALRPVLIGKNAFGAGCPDSDLIVSPQHRIMLGGKSQFPEFGSQALAPAKALVGCAGVRHMMGKQDIDWIHFACKNHEIVIANACLSESLLLGPLVRAGLTFAQRCRLKQIFGRAPDRRSALNGPAARPLLTVAQTVRQLGVAHPLAAV